jgi:hypothetical protein
LMDLQHREVVVWVGASELACLKDNGSVVNESYGLVYVYTGHRRWARTQMTTKYIFATCRQEHIVELSELWRERVLAMLFQHDGTPSVRIAGERQVDVTRNAQHEPRSESCA